MGEKEALLKNNVIRNSFQRAIVVHGTYGTSEASPGVIVSSKNVNWPKELNHNCRRRHS